MALILLTPLLSFNRLETNIIKTFVFWPFAILERLYGSALQGLKQSFLGLMETCSPRASSSSLFELYKSVISVLPKL